MIKSMTGFGRAIYDASFGRLTVEIQSVNRKYLEVFVSMPKEFGRFEQDVRKWVSEAISRGQVSVRIFLQPNVEELAPNAAMLKGLKKVWDGVAKKVGTNPDEIDLRFLMQYTPLQKEGSDQDLKPIEKAVAAALKTLLEMKVVEGKALAKDLDGRLKLLGKMIEGIEKKAPDAAKKMRQKLSEKMEEVLKPGAELEERVLREVALFAERVDVTEEITRFRSHIGQFKELWKGTGVGRKMDFLIQEMGREVNTIGSKSMDAKISHLVVEMKSELEKMREQVQNIE